MVLTVLQYNVVVRRYLHNVAVRRYLRIVYKAVASRVEQCTDAARVRKCWKDTRADEGPLSDRDDEDFMIVADLVEGLRLVRKASSLETLAMELDVDGHFAAAAKEYRQAAVILRRAAEACPLGHPDVRPLREHAVEACTRAWYVERADLSDVVMPIERHISSIRLVLGAREFLPWTNKADDSAN